VFIGHFAVGFGARQQRTSPVDTSIVAMATASVSDGCASATR